MEYVDKRGTNSLLPLFFNKRNLGKKIVILIIQNHSNYIFKESLLWQKK